MNSDVADPIGRVELIVYCEDIDREYPIAVIDSEEQYSDDREYEDRVNLGYQDKDLMDLSEPEFVRKHRKQAISESMSTFENENK